MIVLNLPKVNSPGNILEVIYRYPLKQVVFYGLTHCLKLLSCAIGTQFHSVCMVYNPEGLKCLVVPR